MRASKSIHTRGSLRQSYARHAPGMLSDRWGFSSHDLNWGTVAWSFTKSAAVGLGTAFLAGGAVALGLIEAPFLLLVGGIALTGAMGSRFTACAGRR